MDSSTRGTGSSEFVSAFINYTGKVYLEVESWSTGSSGPYSLSTSFVPAKPDLTPTAVSTPSSAQIGDSIRVDFSIKNQGTLGSDSFSTGIYLGVVKHGTQYHVRSFTLPPQPAGQTNNWFANVTIPNVPPGNYWLCVYTDNHEQIDELDEQNSIRCASGTIDICSAQVNVIVGTLPSGLSFSVDGNNRTSLLSTTWDSGSSHTLDAPSPQFANGNRYLFSRWSDGGSRSHTVSPTKNTAYVASFTTQHFVSTRTQPQGIGINGGGWYNHNGTASVGPAPTIPGYDFSFWRRDGSQNIGSNPSGVSFTVDASLLIEAVYEVARLPDLIARSVNAPSSAQVGENIRVDWITEILGNASSAAFQTKVYLATEPDGTQNLMGTFTLDPHAAGESRKWFAVVNIPGVNPDSYWVCVEVNSDKQITESQDGNNIDCDLGRITIWSAPVDIVVRTSPSGLNFSVDGDSRNSTLFTSWAPGSTHTLNAISPQTTGGDRYVFESWSDSGAKTHTVSPTSDANYTANYAEEHFVDTDTVPAGSSIPGGDAWYRHGATAFIGPAPAVPSYVFSFWRRNGTQNIGSNSSGVSVTVDASMLIEAIYTLVHIDETDLAITKTAAADSITVGEVLTYTIEVVNNGPDEATGVTVRDNLPSQVDYVSHNPPQANYSPSSGIWDVGSLANRASATLTIRATVNAETPGGTTVSNTARINSSDQADPAAGNDADRVNTEIIAATRCDGALPLELNGETIVPITSYGENRWEDYSINRSGNRWPIENGLRNMESVHPIVITSAGLLHIEVLPINGALPVSGYPAFLLRSCEPDDAVGQLENNEDAYHLLLGPTTLFMSVESPIPFGPVLFKVGLTFDSMPEATESELEGTLTLVPGIELFTLNKVHDACFRAANTFGDIIREMPRLQRQTPLCFSYGSEDDHYTGEDTQQSLTISAGRLSDILGRSDDLDSNLILAHSLGGVVAATWGAIEQDQSLINDTVVITLDSPIAGISLFHRVASWLFAGEAGQNLYDPDLRALRSYGTARLDFTSVGDGRDIVVSEFESFTPFLRKSLSIGSSFFECGFDLTGHRCVLTTEHNIEARNFIEEVLDRSGFAPVQFDRPTEPISEFHSDYCRPALQLELGINGFFGGLSTVGGAFSWSNGDYLGRNLIEDHSGAERVYRLPDVAGRVRVRLGRTSASQQPINLHPRVTQAGDCPAHADDNLQTIGIGPLPTGTGEVPSVSYFAQSGSGYYLIVDSPSGEESDFFVQIDLDSSERALAVIQSEETIPLYYDVPEDADQITYDSRWFGSDVETTLTTPSGRTINRNTVADDVTVDHGPDFETITVSNPEAGEWLIELFGADIPPGGEDVEFNVELNFAPTADAGGPYKVEFGESVQLNDSGSNDPDDDSLTVVWDLNGDGDYETPGRDPVFSAVEPNGLGIHTIGLRVCDEIGACATATATVTVEDTTPPELTVPQNFTVEGDTTGGAIVALPNPTATDTVDSDPVADCDQVSGFFALGATTVTCIATDFEGNSSPESSYIVTVQDTTPPELTVSGDITVEGDTTGGANVALPNATATDAVDLAPVVDCDQVSGFFALGATTVTCTATDSSRNMLSASYVITVQDTTAPVIESITANPDTLDSPNHKMRTVVVEVEVVDTVDPAPRCWITDIHSSEDDNGTGDGFTSGDREIAGDLEMNLRAERPGTGDGRTYIADIDCADQIGNTSTGQVEVNVAHDQGKPPANDEKANENQGKGKGK